MVNQANGFQCTKLKYKQYLYLTSCFLLGFIFFSVFYQSLLFFCLCELLLYLIFFYLMYYQDKNTGHKGNYPPYQQTLSDSWGKTGNKMNKSIYIPWNYYLQQLLRLGSANSSLVDLVRLRTNFYWEHLSMWILNMRERKNLSHIAKTYLISHIAKIDPCGTSAKILKI